MISASFNVNSYTSSHKESKANCDLKGNIKLHHLFIKMDFSCPSIDRQENVVCNWSSERFDYQDEPELKWKHEIQVWNLWVSFKPLYGQYLPNHSNNFKVVMRSITACSCYLACSVQKCFRIKQDITHLLPQQYSQNVLCFLFNDQIRSLWSWRSLWYKSFVVLQTPTWGKGDQVWTWP